jgi:hypothetical protein
MFAPHWQAPSSSATAHPGLPTLASDRAITCSHQPLLLLQHLHSSTLEDAPSPRVHAHPRHLSAACATAASQVCGSQHCSCSTGPCAPTTHSTIVIVVTVASGGTPGGRAPHSWWQPSQHDQTFAASSPPQADVRCPQSCIAVSPTCAIHPVARALGKAESRGALTSGGLPQSMCGGLPPWKGAAAWLTASPTQAPKPLL